MEQDEPRFEFYDIEVDPDQEFDTDDTSETEERTLKVRLDKWLWAARFFKTRALARAAVENGKVYYNGERSKPSREIEIEAILQIRHGRYEKTVIVKGLSTRRRSTEEALQLFEETEDSRIARENMAEYHSTPMGQPMPYGAYNNHAPRFQEQQSYSAFAPPTDQGPKRRAVRFLRRSFVRAGEGLPTDTIPNANQGYDQSAAIAAPLPLFNQQGHFNPNGHAPHVPQTTRQENYPVNTQYGHPEQRQHNSPGNHAGYDNRRSDNYRHDNHGHSHSHHSGHTHNPYRQPDRQPAYNSVQPQNVNQHPYPQAQNHGYQGHHPRHQNNNQNYNYYGPQSYKEANGNIGHLPLKEKETEIEESSD